MALSLNLNSAIAGLGGRLSLPTTTIAAPPRGQRHPQQHRLRQPCPTPILPIAIAAPPAAIATPVTSLPISVSLPQFSARPFSSRLSWSRRFRPRTRPPLNWQAALLRNSMALQWRVSPRR